MANMLDCVEFAIDDIAQATAFYEAPLGWSIHDDGASTRE